MLGIKDLFRKIYKHLLNIFLFVILFSVHRIYQHPSRDRRDGDSQLETDGGQPPPPHCRGLQGPGQPTDASHGTSQEEGQVIFLSPPHKIITCFVTRM